MVVEHHQRNRFAVFDIEIVVRQEIVSMIFDLLFTVTAMMRQPLSDDLPQGCQHLCTLVHLYAYASV